MPKTFETSILYNACVRVCQIAMDAKAWKPASRRLFCTKLTWTGD
jgi:hypothetical protein